MFFNDLRITITSYFFSLHFEMSKHVHGSNGTNIAIGDDHTNFLGFIIGAFNAGEWIAIEDCSAKFQNRVVCKNSCDVCPRSRSKGTPKNSNEPYDGIMLK
jgi:hypothetical protein